MRKKEYKPRVGDVIRIVLEDHNVPDLDDVNGGELTFEAFGRVVLVHPKSYVLQTWGNLPTRKRPIALDENTEMLRILKRDILSLRRLR